ncbi:hypothetical protein AAE478_005221 [Parahypoxylon ruwenzoriense]
MVILRHYSGKIVLVAACLVVVLLTSERLSEWSLQSSTLGSSSLRRPYNFVRANSSSSVGSPQINNDLALPPPRQNNPLCASFPDTSNILVIVKTGATESYSKIPTQLLTTLRCVPDLLIFSDLEQSLAGFHVHDSLVTVSTAAKDDNPDFDLYRRQQACPVDQQSCNAGRSKSLEGWRLDKYKNVHIAEKAYQLHPNYDWYLFIDADTYVLWNNLVMWLRGLDPSGKRYIGSVTLINNFRFAHGGSGYLLSQPTMHGLVGNHSGIANYYDTRAKTSCCGDHVLGLALKESADIDVEQAEFEKRFYESHVDIPTRSVLRFRDIYAEFIASKLVARRDNWDNLSGDVLYLDPDTKDQHEQRQRDLSKNLNPQHQDRLSTAEREAPRSFEHCRRVCDEARDCFQFSYHAGLCAYGRSFRLGKPATKVGRKDQKWISGWAVDRIQAWVSEKGQCEEPVWPLV